MFTAKDALYQSMAYTDKAVKNIQPQPSSDEYVIHITARSPYDSDRYLIDREYSDIGEAAWSGKRIVIIPDVRIGYAEGYEDCKLYPHVRLFSVETEEKVYHLAVISIDMFGFEDVGTDGDGWLWWYQLSIDTQYEETTAWYRTAVVYGDRNRGIPSQPL